jgi:tRNA-specific 2-thiouridylase
MNIKYVATGHYARLNKAQSSKFSVPSYQLLMAKDKGKDQTYNLCWLKYEWLKYLVFPLGDYTKKQVYQMAKQLGFEFLISQKQSQDFCYLANNDLAKFLQAKIKSKPGKIVNEKDKILGAHRGLHFYTLGQRKGLKINNGPWFVKKIDLKNNLLVVTKNEKEVAKKEVYLSSFNFISFNIPTKPIKVLARVRYRQPLAPALLYPPLNNQLKLVFTQPQKAVTPGQFAVFYLSEVCLGGGQII